MPLPPGRRNGPALCSELGARIRRNPRVQVAQCGVFGTVTGAWAGGRCRIVEDAAHEKRAYATLDAKYGRQMRLGTWLRRLVGGLERRVILEVRLET